MYHWNDITINVFAICFSFFIERCWSVGEKEGGGGLGYEQLI